MFVTTLKIKELYYRDEFSPFIVYGGTLGIGKSSYSFKVLHEIYESWEKVKKFIVFKPEDFVDRCWSMMEHGIREKAIIWDDAGLHLSYLNWGDPFVQAVVEYLNVARTNWAAIILTAPTPNMIVKKLRGFPDRYTLKIIKTMDDRKYPMKPRRAVCYQNWIAPDLKKSGVHKCWEDDYVAMLPNDFYKWYKPLRDTYAAEAIKRMKDKLKNLSSRDIRTATKELEQITQSIASIN